MTLVNDRPFQMRASKEFLEQLDNWRRMQKDLPSRAEAIRRLVTIGMHAMAQVPDDTSIHASGSLNIEGNCQAAIRDKKHYISTD